MTTQTIKTLETARFSAANASRAQSPTVSDSTAKDARFWDKIAAKYAKSKIGDPAGYERTLSRVVDHLQPTDRVLEVGCGTGTTALKLAPHAKEIVATDISPAMVEIARGKAHEQGIDTVHFVAATADDVRFSGEQFDAVLAFNLFHLVTDIDAALAAIAASIKPGGLLMSKTPSIGEMNPLIRWVMIPTLSLIGKAPSTVHCLKFGDMERAFDEAGFDVILEESHASKGKDTRPFLVARKR
ncbi:MAG: class I SAM-dependent methyltransferase [Pseudomonadota bacterium]